MARNNKIKIFDPSFNSKTFILRKVFKRRKGLLRSYKLQVFLFFVMLGVRKGRKKINYI